MKRLLTCLAACALVLPALLFAGCSEEALKSGEGANINSIAERDKKRGTYMAETMYDTFFMEEAEYARRNIPALEGESDMSDCWRFTGLFSMMLRCNEVNGRKYDREMNNLISAFDYYKGVRSDNELNGGEGREFTVFAVNRSTRGKNRANAFGTLSVFDDQIWIAREYYNAYMLYGNKEYLDTAIELSEYIYEVGYMPNVGGITWGQDYSSRHSCSNAPFVKVLVDLSREASRPDMLQWAKNVYDFTYSVLRDPEDDLYYDNVGTNFDSDGNPVSNGNVDKTKFTYNSGAMISAGVALYNATGEQHYLDEAKATAEGCYTGFGDRDFLEGYTMYPTATTTWFNLVMYIGYYDLFLADHTQTVYLDDVQRTIDYAYEHFGHDGFIPVSWLVGWENGWSKSDCKNLLDHSSHAETYLLLAQYQAKKEELGVK